MVQSAAGASSSNGLPAVALFDQGLVQVVQASVTGLEPRTAYVLALSAQADGEGPLQPLAAFSTNPAGAAIVDAIGPIRQLIQASTLEQRRYLVVAGGTPTAPGPVVQRQAR